MTPARIASPIQTRAAGERGTLAGSRDLGLRHGIVVRGRLRAKPSGPVDDAQVWESAPPVVEVEAIADEELVRHREAGVPEREVVDEPAVRAIEESANRKTGGLAQPQRLDEVIERQARVDDVFDQDHVAVGDDEVEILDEADLAPPAESPVIAGEDDEIESVRNRYRPRQIGQEDERALEDRDEDGFSTGVVGGDLLAELADTGT